jgi:hypothetical protein
VSGLELSKGLDAVGIKGDSQSAELLDCVRSIKGPVYPQYRVYDSVEVLIGKGVDAN